MGAPTMGWQQLTAGTFKGRLDLDGDAVTAVVAGLKVGGDVKKQGDLRIWVRHNGVHTVLRFAPDGELTNGGVGGSHEEADAALDLDMEEDLVR